MDWSLWYAFAATSIVLDLTPGPAVLLVLSNALRYSGPRAVFTILGILSANATYFALSATSVGALLLTSYRIFFLVKWIGTAYLLFLGVKTLLSRESVLIPEQGGATSRSGGRLFVDGFLLQMSNPKALLYFAAILPQFVEASRPVASQIALLGLTSILTEFVVLSGYAAVAGRAALAVRQPRYSRLANRISGAFLLGAGGGLAVMRRD